MTFTSFATVKKHYYDKPYDVRKGDTVEFKLDNLTISVKELEGKVIGYRKVYDWKGTLLAVMPMLQNPHESK
jgi:ASC-1-like (ASCH) protein